MNFQICFTCPDRFCKLLPGDLGSNAIFLQDDLIGQALASFRLAAVVIGVELDFRISESSCPVQIHIHSNTCLAAIPYDWGALQLETESIISQVMLQSFWKVHYSECRGCPG